MFQESKWSTPQGPLNVARGPASGPPLVLLHGVTRTWRDWVALMPHWAARYEVWAVDLRGHGQSHWAASGAYRVADYAADVRHLITTELGSPPILFGHSLGSLVTAHVAAEIPVRAVVLEDLPCELLSEFWPQSSFREMFLTWAAWAREGLSAADWNLRLASQMVNVPGQNRQAPLGTLRDAAALRFSAQWLSHMDPRVFDDLVGGHWWSAAELRQALAGVTAPVLVLQGNPARGGMCADAVADQLRPLVRDGCWIRLDEAGHLIHQMNAETLLRLFTSFCESLDP